MNIAELSIKRPTFIFSIFFMMMVLGYFSLQRMPVDIFPDVTFPIVTVSTVYPGASPLEVETLLSKPIEDEVSTISGIKNLRSINKEGVSIVVVEFVLGTDIRDVEQQVKNHVDRIRFSLPKEIEDPVIYRLDPSNQPIMIVSLMADNTGGELFDLADKIVAPKIQQIPKVGLVEILGARKREIHVELSLEKLREYKISASQVSQKIAASGQNVPLGKVDEGNREKSFRLLGEYPSIQSIGDTIVSFFANDRSIKVSDLGRVVDQLKDEKNRTFLNGKKTLLLHVYKQSKTNTVEVATNVRKKVESLQEELSKKYPGFHIQVVQDSSKYIHESVVDVKETILIGIFLTVIVVFFFLGNFRSTVITGLALPNSLLGAFVLMLWAGFSLNIMSLLALSLVVGLLIDDAIVVRENIARHLEEGEKPLDAARNGTKEVMLAVVATSFTVLAVFGPVGFLQGVVGQFFREFGLTVCFAMIISLLDALTMAPMLSAYFAAPTSAEKKRWGVFQILFAPLTLLVRLFDRFQTGLEKVYHGLLKAILKHPLFSLSIVLVIAAGCFYTVGMIPKTFLPPQDSGEFAVHLEMTPGTSLDTNDQMSQKVDSLIRQNKEVFSTVLTVGDREGSSHISTINVQLVPSKLRSVNTTQFKEALRNQLKPFTDLSPKVTDIDYIGGGMRPFNLNIVGSDLQQLEEFSVKVYEKLRHHPALLDPEFSHKPGKPEFRVATQKERLSEFGLSSAIVGQELRTLVEGDLPAVFREQGKEYDIRVRLMPEERNLRESFSKILVPNLNYTMVSLQQVATLEEKTGPVVINRENRGRYIQIAGDIAPESVGMGGLIQDVRDMFAKELPPPPGISYTFVGQAEDFAELMQNMILAFSLGILFIYFVLASLYESFITPFAIMLVIPLAACGAFLALFLAHESLNIYSMIGCILLMGVATKNSILLIDYANQLIAGGLPRGEAILKSGVTRLRPILMTSLALIAGMIPVAIGFNEASKERVSMGIAIIGGVISSTLLSLIVVPAVFSYVDRLNLFAKRMFWKISKSHSQEKTLSFEEPQ